MMFSSTKKWSRKLLILILVIMVGIVTVLLTVTQRSNSVSRNLIESGRKPSIGRNIQIAPAPLPVLTDENTVASQHQSKNWTDEDRVVHRVEVCLDAINLTSYFEEMGYMDGARDNARNFFRAVRTFVPENFSNEFYSPCWRTNIQVTQEANSNELRSNVNGVIYNSKIFSGDHSTCSPAFVNKIHSNFTTSIACLPKVFLLGIAKCGTTYAYCLMTKGLGIEDVSGCKEPHWWMPLHSWQKKRERDTKPEHVPPYLLHFTKAYSIMEEHARHPSAGVYYPPVIVDGDSRILHEWVRTYYKEPPLNYCLKPALIPVLDPSAKFVVTLRNPVTYLYSKFLSTCGKFDSSGPDVFHERIIQRIAIFNNCTKKYPLAKCASVDVDEMVDESFYTPDFMYGKIDIHNAMYYLHIYKWLSIVPREKILFMTMEELSNHSSLVNVARKLWNFYDLPKPYTFTEKHLSQCNNYTHSNIHNYHKNPKLKMRADTESVLKEFYRPFNEKLANLLGDHKYLWED